MVHVPFAGDVHFLRTTGLSGYTIGVKNPKWHVFVWSYLSCMPGSTYVCCVFCSSPNATCMSSVALVGPLHWWNLDNYFCRKSLAEKVHSWISCRTGWIHVLICVQHPQKNNMRQTDDQHKPTSSIPSLCQKQVIASQHWHVEGNQCTSKRQVSKSHI